VPGPVDVAENRWLRELLEKIAADLERLADQRDPILPDELRRRAVRIRRRLFEGRPSR
jgi:hypothetical protein